MPALNAGKACFDYVLFNRLLQSFCHWHCQSGCLKLTDKFIVGGEISFFSVCGVNAIHVAVNFGSHCKECHCCTACSMDNELVVPPKERRWTALAFVL